MNIAKMRTIERTGISTATRLCFLSKGQAQLAEPRLLRLALNRLSSASPAQRFARSLLG
jgi:hypothetical protein